MFPLNGGGSPGLSLHCSFACFEAEAVLHADPFMASNDQLIYCKKRSFINNPLEKGVLKYHFSFQELGSALMQRLKTPPLLP